VLSGAGGMIGLCLTFWVLPLLLRFAPDSLPRLNEVGLNWRMAVFVAVVSLGTPLLFCLAPLVHTIYSAISHPLRGEGRASTLSRGGRSLMSGAVVIQFSLAFLLLTTAGLLIRSFLKASETDPGFRPEHLVSMRIALPDTVYKQPAQISGFFDGLLTRLSALPGVQQTGAVSDLPMYSSSNRILSAEGRLKGIGKVDTIFCIGNAIESLRVPLLRGRLLQPGDGLGKPRAAVLTEPLAKQIWPYEKPIGTHIKFGYDLKEPWVTVVSVVGDIKDRLTSHSPRTLLFTTPEDWVREMNVLVRASSDGRFLPSTIRHVVHQIDASLPVGKIETVDQVLNESLSAERFRTWLLTSFAAAALLLAMLGIAGLLTYNTAQRKQEFGVRIALGADRRDLLLLVFRHGLQLSAIGIAVGILGSLLVTRAVSALLDDTSPHELSTFVTVPLILVLVALAATLFPAWRAVRTDPMTALRAE
jgi:predicted permease